MQVLKLNDSIIESHLLGRGSFVETMTHPTKNDRVFKWMVEVAEEEAVKIVRIHESYIDSLKHSGIAIVDTEIKFISNGAKATLYIEQDRIKSEQLGENIVLNGSKEEVVAFCDKLFSKVASFLLSRGSGDVGLDTYYRNYALVEGQVLLIDTFPAFVGRDVSIGISRELMQNKTPIFNALAKVESLARWGSDIFYQSESIIAHMYKRLRLSRPELSHELRSLIEEKFDSFLHTHTSEDSCVLRKKLNFADSRIGRMKTLRFIP